MLSLLSTCLGLLCLSKIGVAQNSTYSNPILPGWHSDPTCIFVPEEDNTFFCVTSTFLAFPGLPVYASKDLQNWKLVSSVLNRPAQFPGLARSENQQGGIYAPTLRYRNGTFYVIVVSVSTSTTPSSDGLIFTSTDPYDDTAWTNALRFDAPSIDSDLFWDDDGQAYSSFAGIVQGKIDVATGTLGETYSIWNGTGGVYPEGPHIYKKDDYYYLMIAEGGTELGHSEVIARSKNVTGPFEAYENNPILTNRNTTEYFQTVGHAGLFQDANGNWWGSALSTRSGPQWVNYPMGRETVLFPVTWEEGQWPVCQQVRGQMTGWPLPAVDRDLPGDGPFVNDSDTFEFASGSAIPKHLLYWRFPNNASYVVSPVDHANTLQLSPSVANLTATNSSRTDPITFISRRQSHTYFKFSIDVTLNASAAGEEAGITAFLTQDQHIDLSIILQPASNSSASATSNSTVQPALRFQVTGRGTENGTLPATTIVPIPDRLSGLPITLHIDARNDTHFAFYASASSSSSSSTAQAPTSTAGEDNASDLIFPVQYAPTTILSGGTGPFTGTLLGAFATTNGGQSSDAKAYISRWRYDGLGQKTAN